MNDFDKWKFYASIDRSYSKKSFKNGLQYFLNSLPRHTQEIFLRTKQEEDNLFKTSENIKRVVGNLDPGTSGDAAEDVWKKFLQTMLPDYRIVTKGRISCDNGDISPQVDILVLDKNLPEKLVETKVYPFRSVIAAFECKLSLRTTDLGKTIRTASVIKKFGEKKRDITQEHSIFYGVLALSHDIHSSNKLPCESTRDVIMKHCKDVSPLGIIDFIVVPNDFCIVFTNRVFCYDIDDSDCPLKLQTEGNIQYNRFSPDISALGYFCYSLLFRMSQENSNLRRTVSSYEVFKYKGDHTTFFYLDDLLLDQFVGREFLAGVRDGSITEEDTILELWI